MNATLTCGSCRPPIARLDNVLDDFFASIESGDAAAVRMYLERDRSFANAVDSRTLPPYQNWRQDAERRGSGLAVNPPKPPAPRSVTALHVAVTRKHLEIASLLLEFGADVNATTKSRSTPLHFAMQFENSLSFDFSQLLIKWGADVNARDGSTNTPLHLAFRWRWDALPVVELLLANGADVNAANKHGETPLDRALIFLGSPLVDHARMTRTLLRYGAKVNPIRVDEKDVVRPMLRVARNGNREVARILIEAGADVNVSDDSGTPLHYAAERGNDRLVELLLVAGADRLAADSEGRKPIDRVKPYEEVLTHFERLLGQQ